MCLSRQPTKLLNLIMARLALMTRGSFFFFFSSQLFDYFFVTFLKIVQWQTVTFVNVTEKAVSCCRRWWSHTQTCDPDIISSIKIKYILNYEFILRHFYNRSASQTSILLSPSETNVFEKWPGRDHTSTFHQLFSRCSPESGLQTTHRLTVLQFSKTPPGWVLRPLK